MTLRDLTPKQLEACRKQCEERIKNMGHIRRRPLNDDEQEIARLFFSHGLKAYLDTQGEA